MNNAEKFEWQNIIFQLKIFYGWDKTPNNDIHQHSPSPLLPIKISTNNQNVVLNFLTRSGE